MEHRSHPSQLLSPASFPRLPFPSVPSSALVVDQSQAVKFALDIASGMAFLHTLEPMVSRLYLNSKHVMVRRWKKQYESVTAAN